jgi:hypothetical protein
MDPAAHIAKLGFRRWYERQLIEAHAYLVASLICMIVVAATLETFLSIAPLVARSVAVVSAFAGGGVAWLAWRRYRAIMLRAEWMGDRATCPACGTYGRFRIRGSRPRRSAAGPGPSGDGGRTVEPDDDALGAPPSLDVECKQCGHPWTI